MPGHDLRSAAVDYQRDRANKHKWKYGFVPKCTTVSTPQRTDWWPCSCPFLRCNCRSEGYGPVQPQGPPVGQSGAAKDRALEAKDHHNFQLARKRPILQPDNNCSDSSADEEVTEASAAPEPDADITYSYDARSGPSHGSQILGAALSQAVEQFENKVTDKIVKEEYDVIENTDIHARGEERRTAARRGAATSEEDYEFV